MTTTTITLLTSPACKLCDHAKEVLDRLAEERDLMVETVSIESGRGRQLMLEHKVAFPPGVLIDGHAFSYGRLSERKLRRELARRTSSSSHP